MFIFPPVKTSLPCYYLKGRLFSPDFIFLPSSGTITPTFFFFFLPFFPDKVGEKPVESAMEAFRRVILFASGLGSSRVPNP